MIDRARPIAIALVCAAALVGCGGDDDPGEAAGTTTTDTACSPTVEPGITQQVITTSEGDRSYQLAVPEGPTPHPLLFDFHGTSGTIAVEDRFTGMAEAGTARGYVVVTPQGEENPTRWTVPGIPGPDDIAFVHQLIDQLSPDLCIDTARIFATGISSGAAFSSLLGCESDRFAGIAPVAGVSLARRCPTGPPIGVISFHGTADEWVAYDGPADWETVEAEEGTYFIGSVDASMEAWAERNGCDPGPVESGAGAETTRRAWTGCASPVELYVVDGGGHSWPGASEAQAELGAEEAQGPMTEDIEATTLILDHFDATPSLTS